MRKIGFVLLCALALSACGGSPAAVAPAAPAATAVPTSAPTEIPKPTNTPAPTSTPKPTNTPKPTATPTETPSPTPVPEPVKLSGTGKVVTDKFTPPAGVSRVTFDYQGERNFIVHSYTTEGDEDYLANTIGAYHGQALILGRTPMYFEVDAAGPWTAVIEPVFKDGTEARQLSGHGDTVSDAFDPPSGPVPYVVSHNGKRNFIVHLYCAGGEDFVVNEIGAMDGQVVARFEDGPCLWAVQADGDWSLKPK